MVYLNQILHTYLFLLCSDTGMQNDDESLPRIILACRGLLMKILLKSLTAWYILIHYAFLHILTLSRHWCIIIILNLDQWMRWIRCCAKRFIFSSGCHFFQQQRTDLAILPEGLIRKICVKLFRIWTNGSGEDNV